MSANATKTILYVEDNVVNQLLVQAIFEARLDIRVLIAVDGQTGLRLAEENRPELILLDLNLPDMDGQEYLKRLHDTGPAARVPIVILSADVMTEPSARLQRQGVVACITKPFDIEQLEQTVDRCLGTNSWGRNGGV